MNPQRCGQPGVPTLKVWTVYSWVAKPGQQSESVLACREFAKWIVRQTGSTGSTRLFSDKSDTRHFMSVDSWEDERAFRSLLERSEFNRRMDQLRKHLTKIESWPCCLKLKSTLYKSGVTIDP